VFDLLTFVIALLAGAVASTAGFGIGSILTPWLSTAMPIRTAIAAVSVPHVLGTALRFWLLRASVDRRVFVTFGIMSAVGGLAGAWLHTISRSAALTAVFAALLIFSGLSGLTGLNRKMHFHGKSAWLAGALSGAFGGYVGNQGGIRAAALMAFDLGPKAFVGTATAVGLVVDLARMPIYLATGWSELANVIRPIAVATAGVLAGTWVGRRSLERIPDRIFRPLVSTLILALGVVMLLRLR
jgi:uncharacterized membrane protein YfcA